MHARLPMKNGLTLRQCGVVDATYKALQTVTKTPISIRLDVRVLDAFKATGEGWQTLMNDALTEWADQQGMLEHSSN